MTQFLNERAELTGFARSHFFLLSATSGSALQSDTDQHEFTQAGLPAPGPAQNGDDCDELHVVHVRQQGGDPERQGHREDGLAKNLDGRGCSQHRHADPQRAILRGLRPEGEGDAEARR